MSQERFDEWLKGVAGNDVPLQELEGDWQLLQKRLQGERKRRGGIIWWITGASLILILLISMRFVLIEDKSQEPVRGVEETEVLPVAQTKNEILADVPQSMVQEKINKTNYSGDNKEGKITNADLSSTSDRNAEIDQNTMEKSLSQSAFENKGSDLLIYDQGKEVANAEDVTEKKLQEAVFLDQEVSPNTPIPSRKFGDTDLNVSREIVLVEQLFSGVNPLELQHVILLEGEVDDEPKMLVSSKKNLWILDGQITAGGVNSNYSGDGKGIGSIEQGRESLGAEVKMWRRLDGNWRIGAGFGAQYSLIRANQSETISRTTDIDNGLVGIVERADGSIDTIRGKVSGRVTTEIERTNNHTYWSLTLPVGIGYDVNWGSKSQLSLEFMFMPEYSIRRSGVGILSQDEPIDLVDIEERYKGELSWTISPRLSYGINVSERTSFQLGVRYDWNVAGQKSDNLNWKHDMSRWLTTAGLMYSI